MGEEYIMKGNRGKKRGAFKRKENAERKFKSISERKERGRGRNPKEILKGYRKPNNNEQLKSTRVFRRHRGCNKHMRHNNNEKKNQIQTQSNSWKKEHRL